MSGAHDWVSILVGPAVVVFVLGQFGRWVGEWYRDWRRMTDVALSVCTELRVSVPRLAAARQALNPVIDRIRAGDQDRLFVTANPQSTAILQSVRDDFLRLPRHVVEPALRYHFHDVEIGGILAAIMADTFHAMTAERKVQVLEMLGAFYKQAEADGTLAIEELEIWLGGRRHGFATHVLRVTQAAIRRSDR